MQMLPTSQATDDVFLSKEEVEEIKQESHKNLSGFSTQHCLLFMRQITKPTLQCDITIHANMFTCASILFNTWLA